jgi:LuxR family transcriptional regulator, maltose regulon positive regulatory protein
MGLNLSAEEVAALEKRTEGWVAGLQLAALSMQGKTTLPRSSARLAERISFVLDYLLEEVLHKQPERHAGIFTAHIHFEPLERFGLCDALVAG